MIYELQLLHIYIRSAMLNEFGVYKLYRVSYYFEITCFLRDSIIQGGYVYYFFQIFSRLCLFDGLQLLISEKVLKTTIIWWATTIQ